ncbi:MAG: LysM peptidoglycan-binding domain-containing protein [Armatimonadetes bacterium]|nr:LysM peptidoglycan-binding domain-containing protein [Armatimonadota bacterium]
MSTTEGQDTTPTSALLPTHDQVERQLRRERSLLVTALVLALALLLLMRVGTRVWAIAVWDPVERTFVEHVYLTQRAQAEEAKRLVLRRAQATHPYYNTADGAALFGRANPGFEQRVRVAPARRMVVMPQGASGSTPVVAAADALGGVLKPVVDAWAIYDLGTKRPITALPTKDQADQALHDRLAAVSARVRAELSGNGVLLSEGFLQKVEVRAVRGWPVAKVLTVPQAVAFLSGAGDSAMTHVVVQGESAKSIAAKYNARIEDLLTWNNGLDLARLRAGDRLLVRRPEAPLTVLTVERRTYRQDGQTVTMEVRRHDGVETNRLPSEQAKQP